MKQMNVWESALRELEQTKNLEIINNVNLIGSDFSKDVVFNNLGVLQESIGQSSLAKTFFLKSLGENFFNIQVWNNFLSVDASQVDLKNESVFYSGLYLLQSNFAVKILFLIFLFTAVYCLFKYFAHSNSMIKMIKEVTLSTCLFGLFYFINSQKIFIASKKNLEIYDGPSIIYKTEDQIKSGSKLIKLKSNNGFIKVFAVDSNAVNFWVKQDGVLNL